MRTKNKLIFIITFFLSFLFTFSALHADEFDLSAKEVIVDSEKNVVFGKGAVEVTDKEGKVFIAEKVTYKKSEEFIEAEISVQFSDIEGNVIKSDKITYDKKNEIMETFSNSELILQEGYKLESNKILYNVLQKTISSDEQSIFTDTDGNIVTVSMFQYNLEKNLFSSVGNIKIVDANNNKYFFKEIYVDTGKNEIIGSNVSVLFDEENFGLSNKNDPRFVSNDIFMNKNKTQISKGVFTVCQQRKGKCPPWLLQAKKITHDKIKKTIYYDNAVLKIFDVPIFYFPKFFHPDPTVKRQSGFLIPFFTDSTTLGTGFALPYYWAISPDKDLTFTTKTYAEQNVLFLNEYRQAFRNGFLTLDTSYTEGYTDTTNTKTKGSRNHIFAEYDLNLSKDDSYQSDLALKIQRVSNDTFFRVHNINTALVNEDNTNLENKISYNFSNENMDLNITGAVYEDLRKNRTDRYEYILPNILFGKSFFTEKYGALNFSSNAYYKNYDTNSHTTFLNNDIIWNPESVITKNGFVNTIEGMVNNTNYDAEKTTDYKTEGTINELSGVLSFKSSLPLKKMNNKYSNIFSPTFMLRFAPGHMRDLHTEDVSLKYSNLFSTNKTSTIEDGLSAIIGFDFQKNRLNEEGVEEKKYSISMGQVFNPEENQDLPSKSSLDQKMSDVVGEINYNFSGIGKIDYKFAIDHNFNDINYNEISTGFKFGKIGFNLDYLEERNHVGRENYVNAGLTLDINDNNQLGFKTKKNYKTDSTEFYDISYQYANDCLTAGLVFRREFYEDSDVEKKNSLMFKITFIPFGGIKAPLTQQ